MLYSRGVTASVWANRACPANGGDDLGDIFSTYWPLISLAAVIIVVAIHDVVQRRHAILHNFPVIGHLRYLLESIGPEIRQYFVAADKEEQPFNRDERSWIYASSKRQNNTFGFGTTEQIYGIGYPIIKHAAFPFPEDKVTYPGDDPSVIPCTKIIGEKHGRRRPYRPMSIVNISAMSFGALSKQAISALNKGALGASCWHNTGEGGISPYHCFGAELMWQIGTGYFGARDENGFSLDVLAECVEQNENVRAIEIKLSQGAKPGKGGILPAAKVTAEIAKIRGIPVGVDCVSPSSHAEFSSVDELIDFVERIADRTGLPVGIKSAIGESEFWSKLCERMKARNEGPDFISIDGAEGGTGAAPLSFSDHVALPFKVGFMRVYDIFFQQDMVNDIVWVGSAKLGFPDRALVALAMGCDVIQVGREAMLAIGCIQALKCHNGHCPTGVATQNSWLAGGLDVKDKAPRFENYVRSFRKELLSLAHASGYEHPSQILADDIEFSTGVNQFTPLQKLLPYRIEPLKLHMKDLTPVG